MTVWNDVKLKEWGKNGGLIPHTPEIVNPASVDLRWSGRYRIAINSPERWSEVQTADALTLSQGQLYLLDTAEFVKMPANCGGFLMLKSSMGRKGLEHLHAGWFDPEFAGTATLEMTNMHPFPVTIARGQRIVQLVLVELCAVPELSYSVTGKYNGQTVPEVAK